MAARVTPRTLDGTRVAVVADMRLAAVAVAAAALVVGAASAHASDDDEGPPGLAPTTPPPGPAPIDLARDRDAASDRAFASGTAIAAPAGTVDAALRVTGIGGIASLAVGLGWGLEVSFDATYVVPDNGFYGIGLKAELAHGQGWAIAVDASVHQIAGNANKVYAAGAKLTGCMAGAACDLLATASAGVLVIDDGSDTPPQPYVTASALIGHWAVKPMLELGMSGALGYGLVGMRVGNRHVAFDTGIALVALFADDGGAATLGFAGLQFRP